MGRARTAGTLLAAAAMLVALGSPVEAQSRHQSGHPYPYTHGRSSYGHFYRAPTYHRYYRPAHRTYYRPYYRPSVRFYGYFGYPYYYYPYYWPSFGLYYGYGYPGYYPGYSYPYYYGYGPDRGWASVRIEVKPKQAKVYVDGYYAGIVDDYDGTFQRLHVPPGNHLITVYLEGYRSIEQTLYFSPDSSYKIKQEMVPLAAGEAQEPPPQPTEEETPPPSPPPAGEEGPGMVMPPVVTTPRGEAAPPAQPPPAGITSAPASDFGVLEVRVQPEGVQLRIDSEPWPTAESSGPISIHLAQGRHRVEIEKPGYQSFSGEVVVSSGRTTTLNVKLSSSTERREQSSLPVRRPESR